jgi:hypothetical protein
VDAVSSPELFEGVRLKLDRMQVHLDELHRELDNYRDRHPVDWGDPEIDETAKIATYYAHVHEQPKPHFGAIVGDCIQNLRSALDYLIYALSAPPNGSPPPNAALCAFPITSDKPSFDDKRTQQRITELDSKAQSLVRWWQPYRRGTTFASHPLWLLHELSNWDKHRLLLVATTIATSSKIGLSVPARGLRFWLRHEPLEDGAPVAKLDYSKAHTAVFGGGTTTEVDVDATLGYGVSFLNGPASGIGVTYLLEEELIPFVEGRVIPSFMRFF